MFKLRDFFIGSFSPWATLEFLPVKFFDLMKFFDLFCLVLVSVISGVLVSLITGWIRKKFKNKST